MLPPTLIPSPSRGEWHLGPFPLRAYALAIVLGIVAAWWIGTRRYAEKGGSSQTMLDVTFWAVPFGILGGRIYHVATSPETYFGLNGNPLDALKIWEGGLGIWGAIALGGLGAWIGARRAGARFAPIADSLAPGILLAQAIGRIGNWFNQELFGRPTDLPWGLQVSDRAALDAGFEPGTFFHPTFAYEIAWCAAGAAVLILLDRRLRLGHGRLFALYVLIYTVGRGWIEMLRIDKAHVVAGLRLNVWTSILVGVGAIIALVLLRRRDDAEPEPIDLPGRPPDDEPDPKDDAEPDDEPEPKDDAEPDDEPEPKDDAEPDAPRDPDIQLPDA